MMKGGTMVTFAESTKTEVLRKIGVGGKNDQEGFMHWGSL